jgi:hypothetical protein
MPSVPTAEIMERTYCLISAAAENVRRAKLLCQTARKLRHNNADFHDFLFEARLAAFSKSDRRRAERSIQPVVQGGGFHLDIEGVPSMRTFWCELLATLPAS